MSRLGRRRRGQGGPQFYGPSGTLPLPLESVQQVHEGRRVLELLLERRPDQAVYQEPFLSDLEARPGRRGMGRSPISARRARLGVLPRALGISPTLKAQLRQLRVWSSPRRVRFCVQRKVRKEVLFALGVGGRKGVGRGKRWRRRASSLWRC